MNTSTYAPILIPTLCRSSHFKQCIESLANNIDANKTEVFIGLDYPLNKSHEKGYQEICNYLESSDIKTKFKEFHIYKRERNYGSSKNIQMLMLEIKKKFDRFIYTEDDNVFSPNFIQFMNKGLNMSAIDKSIFAVCGYTYYPDAPRSNNNYNRTNIGFCAWGYGILFAQRDLINKTLTRSFLLKKLLNPIYLIKMAHHSYSTLLFSIIKVLKPQLRSDNIYNLYMWFAHKDVLMPVVSKVRNIGCDGSGEHCIVKEDIAKREIDTETTFEYIGTGKEHYDEINAIHLQGQREYMTGRDMINHIKNMLKMRLKRIF